MVQTVADLVRETQIAKRRSIAKTVGDLMSRESTHDDAESDLLSRLAECERAYQTAWSLLVSAKLKVVAGLSPSARAALEIVGSRADLEVKRLGVERHELQKAIASARAEKSRGVISKNLGETVAQLRKFRGFASAVTSGKVKLGEADRRRLGIAISCLEIELREAMR